MNTIIPFQFESHALRVQLDDAGQPWFNANDVCAVLGMANSRKAIAQHVTTDDVAKRDTLTAGGGQSLNYVNESGLYALIFGSTKEAAIRFKHWVTSEVLPAIRKTGTYSATGTKVTSATSAHDCVSAILRIGETMAKVPGVRSGMLAAEILACIQKHTGIEVEGIRRSLPPTDEPICSLNATQLGKLIGVSAKAANYYLANHGFQLRNERDEWELTETGELWAEALPYSRNGHSGYQILWNPAVAKQLQEVV